MTTQDVTLVQNAVHNPSEPRHFMRIVPAETSKIARHGDHTVADSTEALIVKEVGHDIYDPVVYFPRADVAMDLLVRTDKSTHCPLKGDTEYFDLVIGDERHADAAWSYIEIIAGSELQDLVAFNAAVVAVT